MSEAAAYGNVASAERNSAVLRNFGWYARELVASTVWLFFAVKLLVYDVDLVVASNLHPAAGYILKYKFFFLLGSTAVLWLVLGNRRFATVVIYVFFYPFVLLLWRVPKVLLKNWIVLLVFSPALHSMVTGFRMNFVVASFAILAGLSIITSKDPIFLLASMLFLAVFYCRHLYRKFRMAFQPASVFANVAGVLRRCWAIYQTKIIPEQVKAEAQLDPTSEAYGAKLIENLNGLYTVNSILLIFAEKLKHAAISRKLDIYFIVSVLSTTLLTVIVFALEYLGLEKYKPGSFSGIPKPGFWDFLGYSFSNLMTAGLSALAPHGVLAQVLSHLQLLAALLLLVILVFVILTSIRERYREDVELAISELKNGACLIEGHIQQQYRLSLVDLELTTLVKQRSAVNFFRRCRGLHELEAEVLNQNAATQAPQTRRKSKKVRKSRP